jgi:hypothetical protein
VAVSAAGVDETQIDLHEEDAVEVVYDFVLEVVE